uniref:DUF229 domain containing protein n=1 Tax=Plectus sambesii TaxID=2011161 RepID=A0A914VUB8_9BILA
MALVAASVVWIVRSQKKNFFALNPVALLESAFSKNEYSDQICRIPKLDINAPAIIKFLHTPKLLNCNQTETNWAFIENGRFYIADEAVRAHGPIKCNHFRFWRVSDDKLASDVISDVQNGSMIEKSDFFRAECNATKNMSWSNLFATIVPDLSAIEKAKAVKKSAAATNLNVYIIGFDSLSSLMFQRKLKKTYKFLVQDLEAVILEGYNIVGDGTPQAWIPILTAQTELELPLTRKRYKNASYIDDVYPMIWRNFSERGYVTLYAEDSAAFGAFYYRLKGFNKQPTNHYMRPFFMQAEKEIKNRRCIGSEPQHVTWFRYGENFFDQYPVDVSKLTIMHHSLLSHSDLNLVELADDDLTTHLMRMRDKGHLNNTLLIVMADHGPRFAKVRETHQGQLEERLPFFSFIMPPWFRQSRGKLAWTNLKMNAKRLTTPFDIHATLMDILSWPTDEQLTDFDVPKKRSMSLWRPIPSDRICTEAGVEAHWCTCLNWESADGYASEVNATARALVQVTSASSACNRLAAGE